MNTFTLGACFQHELHTGPYFMKFAPRLFPFSFFCTVSGMLFRVHVYTDTENFVLHSLRSALTQGSLRALHLISRQTCLSGGNPLCWKIYSQSSKLIPGIAIPRINSASGNPFLFLVQLFLEQQIYPWNNCYTWYNLFLLTGTGLSTSSDAS